MHQAHNKFSLNNAFVSNVSITKPDFRNIAFYLHNHLLILNISEIQFDKVKHFRSLDCSWDIMASQLLND